METIEDITLEVSNLNAKTLEYGSKPTKKGSALLRKQLNEFRKQIPAVRKALLELDKIGYKK